MGRRIRAVPYGLALNSRRCCNLHDRMLKALQLSSTVSALVDRSTIGLLRGGLCGKLVRQPPLADRPSPPDLALSPSRPGSPAGSAGRSAASSHGRDKPMGAPWGPARRCGAGRRAAPSRGDPDRPFPTDGDLRECAAACRDGPTGLFGLSRPSTMGSRAGGRLASGSGAHCRRDGQRNRPRKFLDRLGSGPQSSAAPMKPALYYDKLVNMRHNS